MLVEKRFDTGEVVLNYAEGPDNGPPLLLMHGVSGHWPWLLPIRNSAINRWHIYALDYRGHGKSGKTPNKYTLRHYEKDVTKFIEQKLTKPPVLIGHSLGGMVSIMIAGEQRDSVKGIVIGDSQINIDSKETFDRFRENPLTKIGFSQIRDLAASGLSQLEIARELGGGSLTPYTRLRGISIGQHDSTSIGAWVDCLDSYESYLEVNNGYDCDTLFREMTCPVFLVQGNPELGGVMIDKDVEYIRSVNHDVTYYYHEKAGHGIGMANGETAWVHGPLKDFLESVR